MFDVGDPSITPVNMKEEGTVDTLLKNHKGAEFAKFSHLVEGFDEFPFIKDDSRVISIPPLVNCDQTKLTEDTR